MFGHRARSLNEGSSSRLRITPNRQQIDNRFPVLGFTISTGDLSYFEVLLTTNPALFSPENSARRTPATFYASRQDSGLLSASGGEAVYLVPPLVMQSFASAMPRPQAIYFTLIAYSDSQGNAAQYAHDPATLATSAPFVSLAADFRAQTLSRGFAVSADKLRRVSNGATAFTTKPLSDMAGSGADTLDELEDGYQVGQQKRQTTAATVFSYESQTNEDELASDEPQDGYELNERSTPSAKQADYHSYDNSDYDDGFGVISNWTNAQESIFPPTAAEPAALQEHDEYNEDFIDEDAIYDSYGTASGNGTQAARHQNGHHNGSNGYHAFHPPAALQSYDDGYGRTYDSTIEVDDYPDTDVYPPNETQPSAEAYSAFGEEGAAFAFEDPFDDFNPEVPYEPLDVESLSAYAFDSTEQPLTIDVRRTVIEHIARNESGRARYSAINADGEFRGVFGREHPAYQRYHIGLSYGIVQFTQDSGGLGQLLVMMRERDAARFNQVFGEHADELIQVTSASGPSSANSPGGRGARVQPIGGADLWEEPWLTRFRQAGEHVPFQAAQNELANNMFLEPMLHFAGWLGLNTDRALTMVIDRAVQLGRGGARRWIIDAVGPVQTLAQRQQCLTALGYPEMKAFQGSVRGLKADGDWGPQTHAAFIGALRSLGAASPVAIPTRDQMMDMMVRAAAGRRWAPRVERLRRSTEFTDTPYQLFDPADMPRAMQPAR